MVLSSNNNFEEQINVVNETLEEIGAKGKPILFVFNKVDMLENKEIIKGLSRKHSGSVFISAKRGINVASLILKVKELLTHDDNETVIKLKPHDYKGLNNLYNNSEIRDVKYLKTGIKVTLKTKHKNIKHLEKKII